MSQIDAVGTESFDDDEFDAFVNDNQNTQDKERGGNARTFTDILYTDIPQPSSTDPDACRIVRFRGGPPNSDRTVYTARTVISNRIRDDQDKMMTLRLPQDRNHLYWRFINAVLEKNGRGQSAVYENADKMPAAFNRVRYGSASPTANQFKYDKGWYGREWLVANVIDRSMMDVHRSEKHTAILCKDARASKRNPEIVFYDEGVPAYGFIQPLVQSLFKPYKNWEHYDVGIFRTGQKTMPYRLINASRYTPEVPDAMKQLVHEEGPLSEEELSWEMYDLSKLLQITPYSRMLERNGQLFIEVDNYLGSKFFEELQELATAETAARKESEESAPAPAQADVVTSTPVPEQQAVPTRQEIPARQEAPAQPAAPSGDLVKIKEILSSNGFTQSELDMITGYDPSNVEAPFTYNVPVTQQARCPKCGIPSPVVFHKCPSCYHTFD